MVAVWSGEFCPSAACGWKTVRGPARLLAVGEATGVGVCQRGGDRQVAGKDQGAAFASAPFTLATKAPQVLRSRATGQPHLGDSSQHVIGDDGLPGLPQPSPAGVPGARAEHDHQHCRPSHDGAVQGSRGAGMPRGCVGLSRRGLRQGR